MLHLLRAAPIGMVLQCIWTAPLLWIGAICCIKRQRRKGVERARDRGRAASSELAGVGQHLLAEHVKRKALRSAAERLVARTDLEKLAVGYCEAQESSSLIVCCR